MRVLNKYFNLIVLSTVLFAACGNIGINRTIRVADGEKRRGDLNSVNGAIIIGKNCEIRGSCRAVNGGIEVHDYSTVHDLTAVNGSIALGPGVQIEGEVTTINGSIESQSGVVVKDDISTINGNIELNNTRVMYDVLTINGDIFLNQKSVVNGDVIIRTRRGISHDHKSVKITISDSSVVEGSIINRDKNRTVTVVLAVGGQVKGRMQDVEMIQE